MVPFLQAVMVDLVKRYIMSRQSSLQTEEVTEDDLQEIKQDISAFRYELLEILRKGKQEIETRAQSNRRFTFASYNIIHTDIV